MDTPTLLKAIRIVKENEKIARDYYADAAQKTLTAVRPLFEQLSAFEQFHYEKLTELERSQEKSGSFIDYAGKEFILPPKFEIQALSGRKSMIEVMLDAMKLEKKAETAYADLAAQLEDQHGRQMFLKLSEEEHKHYWILERASTTLNQTGSWKWEPT